MKSEWLRDEVSFIAVWPTLRKLLPCCMTFSISRMLFTVKMVKSFTNTPFCGFSFKSSFLLGS